MRNILAGQSTIEVERARPSRKRQGAVERRRFLWLPAIGDDARGHVVRIDPDLKLYDLGPAANWRATMGERPLDWFGAQLSGPACADCCGALAPKVRALRESHG